MSVLLHLETTTRQCSVALSHRGELLASRNVRNEGYSHAEMLLPFIDEVFKESGTPKAELKAVSVSGGPGSYTGLRIGVATAKGICHALNIPFISVDTLTVLATQARKNHPGMDAYVSMLDARRMEVYSRTFDSDLEKATEIEALIIPEIKTFPWDKYENICFIGDGSLKCRDILMGENRIFIEEWPTAEGAVNMATDRFEERKFENLALYEPIYLKQFIAGKAKDPFGLRQEMKK
jgi:tRNA threonylcarbamoyladenosine biosynthesis protein TsaB